MLGQVGDGLLLGLRGFLDVSRLSIAVSALGLARRAMELATNFAEQRITFGKPIATRQAVRLSIGEMAADIYAVQAAVNDASTRFDAGEPITAEAAICKYLGLEMVGRVTDRALRMHGGIGYTRAHKIERHYRDARALWFEEGTAEIQRLGDRRRSAAQRRQLLIDGLPTRDTARRTCRPDSGPAPRLRRHRRRRRSGPGHRDPIRPGR